MRSDDTDLTLGTASEIGGCLYSSRHLSLFPARYPVVQVFSKSTSRSKAQVLIMANMSGGVVREEDSRNDLTLKYRQIGNKQFD